MIKKITSLILSLLLTYSLSLGQEQFQESEGQHRFAIKTNLLYYAALAPNICLENFMFSRWSIGIGVTVPWWSNKAKSRLLQLMHLSSELRYWLRPDAKFERHFFGFYLDGGYYDLKNSDTGYQGNFITAGLSYGYYLPIKARFGMEFSLGVGYMLTEYDKYLNYEPMGDNAYYSIGVDKTTYFGPTKAEISLVWRLGNKTRKGGGA